MVDITDLDDETSDHCDEGVILTDFDGLDGRLIFAPSE